MLALAVYIARRGPIGSSRTHSLLVFGTWFRGATRRGCRAALPVGQHAAAYPKLFRRRERTARFWPPPRPHGTDVAEVHTAGSHSRLRSQRMMAFGTPYQHTSQAISPAPPLRQLAGKTMLLVLQLLRRKPHGGPGAMVLNVECALHLLSGGPHSCQYTGRPLCKRS